MNSKETVVKKKAAPKSATAIKKAELLKKNELYTARRIKAKEEMVSIDVKKEQILIPLLEGSTVNSKKYGQGTIESQDGIRDRKSVV